MENRKIKVMTLAIYFDGEQVPENVTISSTVLGGTVTAMAAYDMFATMEIAEEALEASNCEICADAMEKIHSVITGWYATTHT